MTLNEYKKIMADSPIHRAFYHFTDNTNLSSIGRYGIVSKEVADINNIEVPTPGGNAWSRDADERKGLTDYVNLCFTENHPMCYVAKRDGRIPNPKYLRISPVVLTGSGVKIALDVANKVGVELLNLEEGLKRLDFEVLYNRTNWSDPIVQRRLRNANKYEILVPKTVSRNLILGEF